MCVAVILQSINMVQTFINQETGHPVIKSYEPSENWKWCYEYNLLLPRMIINNGRLNSISHYIGDLANCKIILSSISSKR